MAIGDPALRPGGWLHVVYDADGACGDGFCEEGRDPFPDPRLMSNAEWLTFRMAVEARAEAERRRALAAQGRWLTRWLQRLAARLPARRASPRANAPLLIGQARKT